MTRYTLGDGRKPVCSACARLGLDCEQFEMFCLIDYKKEPEQPRAHLKQLKEPRRGRSTTATSRGNYTAKSASRLKLAGVAESDSSSETYRWAGNVEETQLSPFLTAPDSNSPEMLSFSSMESSPPPAIPTSLSMLSDFSNLDIRLLQYYTEKLSSRLANADGVWNPLRVLVIPRMCSSTVLFHAVCAGSALHMARFSSEDVEHYDRVARLYYVQALSALKDLIPLLNQGQATTDESTLYLDEVVLLTSIFLCKYEIIKDGMSIWRNHLDGVETLYSFLASKYRGSRHDTIEFAHNFLTYHKSVASLTTEVTKGSTEAWKEEPLNDSNQMSPIDMYMGCSQSLFVLLLRVTRLRQLCNKVNTQFAHVQQEIESILEVLNRRRWRLEYFDIPEDMTFGTAESLQHVAQALESCLLVCLHSVIDESAQLGLANEPGGHWEGLSNMLPASKQEALQTCIREIELVPMDGLVEAGLLPLLFVVACESNDLDESLAAIQRVDRLGSNIGIGNQCYAGVLVREIWAQRMQHYEGSWRDFLKISGWKNLILT